MKSAWVVLLLAPAIWGQPGPNPFAGSAEAAEEGRQLFALSCAPCHGRGGEGASAPDLSRGGRPAGDLFRVISQGVPGTAMSAYEPLGTDQIWRLVTFIRTLSRSGDAVPPASAAAGEALFWGKGDCGRCHQIESRGVRFGPDLTRGRRSTAEKLKRAIASPGDEITPGYAVVTVVTRDKKTVSGLERFYGNFAARIVDPSGTERTFLRDETLSIRREMRSLMPDNYGKLFTPAELDELAAYLMKLRSEANQR